MAEAAPIGFVLGTKPASSLEFYVLVDQHNYLEMDDVVFVRPMLAVCIPSVIT